MAMLSSRTSSTSPTSRLGPGTLYGALTRLEGQHLIRALAPAERRRPYAITAEGSAALQEHLTVLARIARTGRQRLASA